MATSRSFEQMINDYLTLDMLRNELNRMYLLQKVKQDNSWVGGNGTQGYVVPFVGADASSVKLGSLTAEADIAEDDPVRGTVTVQPEAWGSMKFHSKDFMQHEGKKREISLLKSVKAQIDPFFRKMKTIVNDALLNGGGFLTVTNVTNAATGVIGVTGIEKVSVGQKVIVREAVTPSAVVGYVRVVNKDSGLVTVYDARTGGAVINLTAAGPLTAALLVGDKFYHDGGVNTTTGAIENNFTSMPDILLSSANGGSASLYGVTKTLYPFLQSLNIDGSTITAANILEKLFTYHATETRVKTKSHNDKKADSYLLSPKNYAAVMVALEDYKGQYYVKEGEDMGKAYAWDSVVVGGRSGRITLYEVPEFRDDIIPAVNWESFVLASNGFFKFNENPNSPGKLHHFEIRAATGYSYIVDIAFMGDLICIDPESNAIIHSISY